jgi:hypothetical protein
MLFAIISLSSENLLQISFVAFLIAVSLCSTVAFNTDVPSS